MITLYHETCSVTKFNFLANVLTFLIQMLELVATGFLVLATMPNFSQ